MPLKHFILFITFLVSLIIIGCNRAPKPVVVTYQLTYSVDTIFQQQYLDNLNRHYDSLCTNNRDIYYQEAVDSILRAHLANYESLINE